ncbi:MAG TPA: ABC transporter ATP-binding protein, partial [Iamia sp.]|nr:ABC transporter ATP-binding protein [Iamia sp.]
MVDPLEGMLDPTIDPAPPDRGDGGEAVIETVGVDKRYARAVGRTLIARIIRGRSPEMAAIDGLDLRIGRGETVGVLGHNGAGKTTLLRLLAGVTAPSVGRVRVAGRIAPLISIGVGFHPELSGRENIVVNGSVLGLSRVRLAEVTPEIIAFSGLADDVLDTPVKLYSSGMLLRLAFAVAVHTDPDVMLVDELLAVGDLAFQQRCLARMAELRARGVTVVLVSHSVFTIREVCDRAIVLSAGRKVFDGPAEEAVRVHQRLLGGDAAESGSEAAAVLSDRSVVDTSGVVVGDLVPGERYRLRATLEARQELVDPHVMFTAYAEDGAIAYQMLSAVRRRHRTLAAGERALLEVGFTAALRPGTYQLTVQVLGDEGRQVLAHDVDGAVVRVAGTPDPDVHGPVPLAIGVR